MRYTVEPGRQIYRDGRPFVSIGREGETFPTEADDVTHVVAAWLNRNVELVQGNGEPEDAREMDRDTIRELRLAMDRQADYHARGIRKLRDLLKDVDIAHQPHAWVLAAQSAIAETGHYDETP